MYRFMRLILAVRQRLRSLNILFALERPGIFVTPLPGTWPWKLDNMLELEYLNATYPSIAQSREIGIIDLLACSDKMRKCRISGSINVTLAEGLVFSSLTDLHVNLFKSYNTVLVGKWYDVLQRMPVLRSLAVAINEDLDWDHHEHYTHPGPFTQIQLPRLEKLEVRFSNEVKFQYREGPYKFLEGLLCPQLKDLRLHCEYSNAPNKRDDPFAHEVLVPSGPCTFLLNNCALLKRLVVEEDLFYDDELANALMHCTGLRHLHFHRMRFAVNSVLFKELILENQSGLDVGRDLHEDDASPPLCPNLECVKITSCFIPSTITTTDVVDMIISRREGESSTLKYVEFDDCSLEGLEEDPRMNVIRDGLLERCEDEVDQSE